MNRRVRRARVVLGVDDSLTGLAALRVAVVEDPAAAPITTVRFAILPASGWIAVSTAIAGLASTVVLACTTPW